MRSLAHSKFGGERAHRAQEGAAKTLRLLVGLCAVAALSGCGDPAAGVVKMAESTRTATEQMARKSREESLRKEIELGGGADLRRPPAFTLVERYETREGPDGYFLYDTQEHTIARFNGRPIAGLTLDQVSRANDALSYADAKRK